MSVFLLILGIVLFSGLILVHEYGHFIAARRGGVEVEEFGLFFGPHLYKRRMKGGWDFTVNLVPIGGYVKLKGEHDTDTEPGSFGAASLWVKSKIMVAGVVMNLLTAFVLFTILALVGVPKLLSNQFTIKSDTRISKPAEQSVVLSAIQKGSPAAKAGLKPNDTITSLGVSGQQKTVTTTTSLQSAAKEFAGRYVTIDFLRGSHHEVAHTTLNSLASEEKTPSNGFLGVGIAGYQTGVNLQRSTWSAPIVAGGLMVQFTGLTFVGLGHAVGGLASIIAGSATHDTVARQHGQTSAAANVGGPVLIVYVLHLLSNLGYQFILMVIALISLTLAITNFLPIPALDGGRLWITLVARTIFKHPLTAHVEEVVNATGLFVLLGLSLGLAILDIVRIVHHTI